MIKNIYIEDYEKSCDELAKEFVRKYFGKDTEYYWIGDEVGGVLSVADYFFNMSHMVDFIRYKYTKNMMFEYYDYSMEYGMKKHKSTDYLINIKNYKYLK